MTEHPRRLDGLEINPVERDRVHYLNHTAVLILELCDGRNTPARIATLLKNAYGLSEAPEKEVTETLVKLTEEGLVRHAALNRTRSRSAPKKRGRQRWHPKRS